jgi:hypothetical protein
MTYDEQTEEALRWEEERQARIRELRAFAPELRRAMLEELSRLESDEDGIRAEKIPQRFLWRQGDRELLEDRYWIVRGGRGSGKSALYNFLAVQYEHPELGARWAPELRYTQSVEIWGARVPRYIADVRDTLARIEERETARWALWMGMLVDRLALHFAGQEGLPALPAFMAQAQAAAHAAGARIEEPTMPSTWLPAAVKTPRPLKYWLDDFVDWWGDGRGRLLLLYDNLDLFWDEDATNPSALIEALLSVWMERPMHRHGRVIPKLFLREDTFAYAAGRLVDAPKLDARSKRLEWDAESLFRVLIHQLADAQQTPHMSAWLQERGFVAPVGEGRLGVMDRLLEGDPAMDPERLLSEVNQASFCAWMIGFWMGKGATRGYPARWIYARLVDFKGVATPRTLINLFREAAATQLRDLPEDGGEPHAPLLSTDAIIEGLRGAAEARVRELNAEYEVAPKLELLRGMTLPIEREMLLRRLAQHQDGQEFTRAMRAGAELDYRDLEALGIFKEVKPGRVDVPELYRYGYRMKRAGAPAPRK